MTTPRRERLWVDEDFNIQVGSTSAITPLDLLSDLDPAKTKVTVVRQLIEMFIYPDGFDDTVDG